ncbi:GNAT family N-acetyltransferase [Nocardioides sp.]|uniref:GNAT family N-acetyltransferase n=1 Tax=Nocardioides sp. TaxID=35761 RepID=UPI00286CDA2D|nr:GNAT family N-acetyltransferase [Nocardioides sp.]
MSHDLLETYDLQLRGESEVIGSIAWDQDGPVWRATYGFGGMVTYRSLAHVAGAELDALVRRSVEHFSADPAVDSVEWKTRSHDVTDDLHGRLLRAGFEPEDEETIMLGEAEALLAAAVEPPAGIVVRRVDQLADRVALLEAAADMQVGVFGRGGSGADLLARVDRSGGLTEVWVAESSDGVVVSAGRLEIVPGTECAGLWGGATLPGWRGRGIYRALTGARAGSAMARGVRYLHSDCTEMSRPILERSGLRRVTTSTPYVWHRP